MKPEKSRLPLEIKLEAVRLRANGITYAAIAHRLGIPYTTIFDALQTKELTNMINGALDGDVGAPRILFFDVETMASVVLAFNRWDVRVSPEAVIAEPYMLTYAAAWGVDGRVFSKKLPDYPDWETDKTSDFSLICELWELLDEADIVIAHNAAFDTKWANARFAFWGLGPPSPYKVICTLREVRKAFKLPANSLKAVTDYFQLERKADSGGMATWKRIYDGDKTAFDDMQTYNIQDIPTLQDIYRTVLPFMKGGANIATYYESCIPRCTKCGSTNLEETSKQTFTGVSKVQLIKCGDCGGWNSNKKNLLDKEKRQSLMRSV